MSTVTTTSRDRKGATKVKTATGAKVFPWLNAFKARDDLGEFGDNAIGLFALALHFPIDDLQAVGTTAITDGNDDKKCDLVYTDGDEGYAVICQCFYSSKSIAAAPANKASDLNTAIGWLLNRDIAALPDRLASPAQELRDAIKSGFISNLHIWYVHNLPESKNVSDELLTVEQTADSAIRSVSTGRKPNISVKEIGSETLQKWYHDTQSPILVTDEFEIPIDDGFEVQGIDWTAYVTSIPARWLFNQWKKHKVRLFSANLRDYLGSRKADKNINHGIKKTLKDDPTHFWAFNNGITIIVNDFSISSNKKRKKLSISGISIVNGAQTTGAIGTESNAPSVEANVQARFIKTTSNEMIRKIVQFNNSQNQVTASDFRSYDSIQRRLKEEFEKVSGVEYEGGRRGGADDAIKRRPSLLPPYTVGQALAAFHGEPVIAYNQKSDIWSQDNLYSRYFCEKTTARHIIFAYTLLKSIDKQKRDLIAKRKSQSGLTKAEEEHVAFLRTRGANYIFASAIAACMETILGTRTSNAFSLKYKEQISLKEGERTWELIVKGLLPLATHLEGAIANGLKSPDKAKEAIRIFHSLVQTTAAYNEKAFRKFSRAVETK